MCTISGIVFINSKDKDWGLEKYTKFDMIFFDKKFRNCVYFFTCILSDYMAHEIPKYFFLNSHFEDMTAGFLLRCQNLLRQISPKMMHFQAWKKIVFTNNAL